MENRSRGALLSLVLLVLGSTLLPEPCDAGPRGFRPRQLRSPIPEPRCPNCARDCPQNLAGDSISEINDDYQPLSPNQYSHIPSQQTYEAIAASPVYTPVQTLSSYNPSPVPSQVYSPPPSITAYNPPIATVAYTPPLPAPPYDVRVPPPPCNPPQTLSPSPDTSIYNCPPSAPSSFNLLPKSQNHYESWSRHSKFNRSPYNAQVYRPRYYPQDTSATAGTAEYDCECGCDPKYQLDEGHDLDEDSFGSYNRRSPDVEAPRVSRHYNHAHFAEPPSPPNDMYKTYVPYIRDENYNDSTNEYTTDENDRRGRDRLYVVYRADAVKPEQQVTEDRPISERELETVVRKAIEIARQQRAHENAQRRRANQQHRSEHNPDSGAHRPQRQGHPMAVRIIGGQAPYVVREEGDEARNPGLDQSKWIAISAVPKSDILSDEETSAEHWKSKDPNAKVEPAEARKPVSVDLMEKMESPQTITESSALVGPAEQTTSKKS